MNLWVHRVFGGGGHRLQNENAWLINTVASKASFFFFSLSQHSCNHNPKVFYNMSLHNISPTLILSSQIATLSLSIPPGIYAYRGRIHSILDPPPPSRPESRPSPSSDFSIRYRKQALRLRLFWLRCRFERHGGSRGHMSWHPQTPAG